MCQTGSLPFGLGLRLKQIGLLLRSWVCFPCVSVRCRGAGSLPSTVLPAVQSWGPRNQASLNFRARRSRDHLKNGLPRVKTRAPDGNRHFPPGASGALEHSRGGAKASLAPLAGVRLRGRAKMAPTKKREGGRKRGRKKEKKKDGSHRLREAERMMVPTTSIPGEYPSVQRCKVWK